MGNGKILMTKTLRADEFEKFMERLIKWLRFPGILSIDAHGFVETKLGEPVFIFGSENSAIELWNGKQDVLLQRHGILISNMTIDSFPTPADPWFIDSVGPINSVDL